MQGTKGTATRSWAEAERFDARTRSLIDMFGLEPAGIANVAIMASDFLFERYGVAARWADLDVRTFWKGLAPPLSHCAKSVRVAFDAFVALAIEHEGRPLPEPRSDGFYLSAVEVDSRVGAFEWPFSPVDSPCTCSVEPPPPNRSERRQLARMARRAARKQPPAR